jgi:hypothetical protein
MPNQEKAVREVLTKACSKNSAEGLVLRALCNTGNISVDELTMAITFYMPEVKLELNKLWEKKDT